MRILTGRNQGREHLVSAFQGMLQRARPWAGTWRAATTAQGPRRTLTRREHQVLLYASEAMTNQQIAAHIEITPGTVKRHLHSVFGKLGAVSRLPADAASNNPAQPPSSPN
ncbi:MAG TPA: hypothetical protein DEQ61_19400 [Streptomyces sp.]|nr:hypothetical protein [Streptomyces sp.]